MAAKDLTGHTFGSWIVIGASEKSGYVKCRCKCGTERDVLRESLTRGASKSCGCVHTRSEAQLKMDERRKKEGDLTGKRFGRWTVLHRAEKDGYFTCQCECGTIKDVYRHSLMSGMSTGCQHCAFSHSDAMKSAAAQKSAKAKKSAIEKYEGKTVSGWKIIEILPPRKPDVSMWCKAVCPQCGKIVEVRLSNITRTNPILRCSDCARDMKDKVDVIRSVTQVDGSSLSSVKSRMGGKVNRNSKTGVNGVVKRPNGRYFAYINFKRKQIYLGLYESLDDAIAARKKAEAAIYGEYLDQHEGWEEELASRLEELKKEKK